MVEMLLPEKQPILYTSRLVLRSFTLADVAAVVALAGDRYASSIIIAIAVAISAIFSSDTHPSLRMNRCSSTPLSCNASMAEGLLKPFTGLGSTRTCQRLRVK